VTYLALTDAVTGMIGILLVVLVLARQPQEEVYQLQQADADLACELVSLSPGAAPTPALRTSGSDRTIPLDGFLRRRYDDGLMSIRISVAQTLGDARQQHCVALLRAEVDRLNAAYEQNRDAIARPYVFLTPYRPEPGPVTTK